MRVTWRDLALAARRPPWRTIIPGVLVLATVLIARAIWQPGRDVTDGRDDLGRNGIWMQHGWLGDRSWFVDNDEVGRIAFFHDRRNMGSEADLLRRNHITDVFPHLCPTGPTGAIMPEDGAQTEAFLDEFHDFRVIPWVGGERDSDVVPENERTTAAFARSIGALLRRHPRLAGVQINVEPWRSGDSGMLALLDQVRAQMPSGKILAVAAYPPPTWWQPAVKVHWDEAYYRCPTDHRPVINPIRPEDDLSHSP